MDERALWAECWKCHWQGIQSTIPPPPLPSDIHLGHRHGTGGWVYHSCRREMTEGSLDIGLLEVPPPPPQAAPA